MFLDDTDRDFRELKLEFGFSRREAWLTKEVATLVLAGGTLLAAALNGRPFSIAKLFEIMWMSS